jgi:hypothetical protein
MDHQKVRQLEEILQNAISKALRVTHQRHVPSRIHHLMAKAAVAVLEATEHDDGTRITQQMEWTIDKGMVNRAKKFFTEHRDNQFVQERIARNVSDAKSRISLQEFWECMVVCLLTSQQKSGPNSAVGRFAREKPFPLSYRICAKQQDLATFVTATLTAYGGIRRTRNIGHELAANIAFLKNGGWKETAEVLKKVRANSTAENERWAAHFIDRHFRGLGPKQSRNLLQGIGLAKYETPIDSRIVKWLVDFGFPVVEDVSVLSNRTHYEFVLDQFQRLCSACNVLPCVFDAAICSSFDRGR